VYALLLDGNPEVPAISAPAGTADDRIVVRGVPMFAVISWRSSFRADMTAHEHVAHRHAAGAVAAGRSVHGPRRGGTDLSSVFIRETPSEPQTWPVPEPRTVPAFAEDDVALGTVVSTLGKTLLDAIRAYATQTHV
jgi:hypothetical protein